MSNVLIRAEQLIDRLIDRGKAIQKLGDRVREMLADGVVDDEELERLFGVARQAEELGYEVEDVALDVQDVGADILHAKQALTIGRHATPNRHLRDHCEEIDQRIAERQGLRRFEGAEQPMPPERLPEQKKKPATGEVEGLAVTSRAA